MSTEMFKFQISLHVQVSLIRTYLCESSMKDIYIDKGIFIHIYFLNESVNGLLYLWFVLKSVILSIKFRDTSLNPGYTVESLREV